MVSEVISRIAAKYHTALEDILKAIIVDAGGQIVFANRRANELFGFESDDVLHVSKSGSPQALFNFTPTRLHTFCADICQRLGLRSSLRHVRRHGTRCGVDHLKAKAWLAKLDEVAPRPASMVAICRVRPLATLIL